MSRELARALRRRRRLRAEVVQLLAIAVAVGLAVLAPHVWIGFAIPTGRAIEMLISIGAGTVTFIGVVFSLLFLVVQFGSTTFTPRLNLFRDAPIVWRASALYAGVVVYSFTAVLVIGRDEETSGLVPIIGFVGILASLVAFRQLQAGAFRSIQLASTLTQVARRGREVIDALYPAGEGGPEPNVFSDSIGVATPMHDPAQEIRWSGSAGVLQLIDVPRVLRAADRHRVAIRFTVAPGQRIPEHGVVALATPAAEPRLARDAVAALTIGEERAFEQDPALALRVLADIALRALSPAVNDPTTAVQALDAIDGLLRALAVRRLDIGQIPGADGAVHVMLTLPSWDDYVAVALDEVIALPALSPNVSERILRLLGDLEPLTPACRRASLETRRRRLQRDRYAETTP